MARLQGSLTEAKGKASLTKCHASEATAEAIEAFRKREDFYRELLESYWDACAMGVQWGKKVAKHFPDIDLIVLSSGESSFGSEPDSFDVDKGGKVTSPIP